MTYSTPPGFIPRWSLAVEGLEGSGATACSVFRVNDFAGREMTEMKVAK
jgi:hypothetical protein